MWDLLWIVLAAIGLLLYSLLRVREHLVIKVGNPFKDEELISWNRYSKGTRVIGFYPDTCPAHKPELDAGLCYPPCAEGYHGVGPVCWANTVNIGPGMFAKLKTCEKSGYTKKNGWVDMGLFCFKEIKCNTGSGLDALKVWDWKCSGGNTAFKEPECPPGGAQASEYNKIVDMVASGVTGSQQRALAKKPNRPNPNIYSDAVGGMCYKPCPKDKPNHALSAPYLCFKDSLGRGLYYGRGVGDVPPPFAIGPG
jgi:hypothetical protein